jgi:hypothetical protein
MTRFVTLPRIRTWRRKPWGPETRAYLAASVAGWTAAVSDLVCAMSIPSVVIVVTLAFVSFSSGAYGYFSWRHFQRSRRRDES